MQTYYDTERIRIHMYYDMSFLRFVRRLTVSKIDCNFFPVRFFSSLSLIHMRSRRFSATRQSLQSSSVAVVYCFIRWETFLEVFKKRESLCLCFAGVLKQFCKPFLSPLSLVDFDVTQLCGTTVLRSRKQNFSA